MAPAWEHKGASSEEETSASALPSLLPKAKTTITGEMSLC